jgi:spore coat polysaccharide biosynthesis protein SpsF
LINGSKIALIIQARTRSTRLPGKVLKTVQNQSLLSILLERVKKAKLVDELIVATSTSFADDQIVQLARKYDVNVYRGSEEDVLDRYLQAAKISLADVVVRVTADCPLLDPLIVDKVINYFFSHDYDYVSNTLQWTYPRGMDVEIFYQRCLEKAAKMSSLPSEREHVTLYIYKHPEIFRLGNLAYIRNVSDYRFTVDTVEDFTLISKILEELYPINPYFTFEDVLALMEKNPGWKSINAHVKQKSS